MGHEGHEGHEQHAFTSPYPCGVAGLVKKRAVSGCAGTPLFSTTAARCGVELRKAVAATAPGAVGLSNRSWRTENMNKNIWQNKREREQGKVWSGREHSQRFKGGRDNSRSTMRLPFPIDHDLSATIRLTPTRCPVSGPDHHYCSIHACLFLPHTTVPAQLRILEERCVSFLSFLIH